MGGKQGEAVLTSQKRKIYPQRLCERGVGEALGELTPSDDPPREIKRALSDLKREREGEVCVPTGRKSKVLVCRVPPSVQGVV